MPGSYRGRAHHDALACPEDGRWDTDLPARNGGPGDQPYGDLGFASAAQHARSCEAGPEALTHVRAGRGDPKGWQDRLNRPVALFAARPRDGLMPSLMAHTRRVSSMVTACPVHCQISQSRRAVSRRSMSSPSCGNRTVKSRTVRSRTATPRPGIGSPRAVSAISSLMLQTTATMSYGHWPSGTRRIRPSAVAWTGFPRLQRRSVTARPGQIGPHPSGRPPVNGPAPGAAADLLPR